MMTPGRITAPRLALAFALVAALCGLQMSQVVAATIGSLASEINALFELQKAGGLSAAEFSAAKKLLLRSEDMKLNAEHVAVESEEGPVASHRPQPEGAPLPPPSEPKQERRKLQQPGGTPLPPPSGTCPDVRGVQQGLDATDARVDALEVYTDVSAAPRGLIGLWSGAYDTVPQGWALCDGTNGTPDLRDKFVVGAGSKYELGSSADLGSLTSDLVVTQLSPAEALEHDALYQRRVGPTDDRDYGQRDPNLPYRYSRIGMQPNSWLCKEGCRTDGGQGCFPYDDSTGTCSPGRITGTGSFYNNLYDLGGSDPVPAHYALAYIMRLDATCCVCYCDDARPTQPVPVVVPYGTAQDVACRTRCAEASACGHAGGHFADAFSSACV